MEEIKSEIQELRKDIKSEISLLREEMRLGFNSINSLLQKGVQATHEARKELKSEREFQMEVLGVIESAYTEVLEKIEERKKELSQ